MVSVAPQLISGKAQASRWVFPFEQLLPGILPDEQSAAHMHVQGADDALLRDLHTHIQMLHQVGWDSFAFIADKDR